MASLATLTQRRAKIRAEMIALQKRADEADPETGAMDADTQAIFDKLKAALMELEAAISNRAAVDSFERAESGTVLQAGDRQFELAKRAFRPTFALAGAAGLRVDDGPEREISAELAKRSSKKTEGVLLPWEAFHRPIERRVVSPQGTGAGIIGTYLDETQYVDALRAHVIAARLGARYMTGLQQQTDFPVLSATATAYWPGDGNPIPTDTSESFGKISLRPHLLGGVCEFTRNMFITSTPPVQDAVRNDLVQVLARGIDLAAFAGTGAANNQPVGILNTPGLTIVAAGANGAAISWPLVLSTIEAAQLANAPETALGWASNPQVRAQCMGTLRFPGVAAGVVMESPDALAGYPFIATTQLPLNEKGTGAGLSTLIYGSFDELLIAMFGEGVECLVNPYGTPQFSSGNIQVRVLASCDIAVKHIASFAACTDLAAP